MVIFGFQYFLKIGILILENLANLAQANQISATKATLTAVAARYAAAREELRSIRMQHNQSSQVKK